MKKKIWLLNFQANDIQSVSTIAKNLGHLYFSLYHEAYEVEEVLLTGTDCHSQRDLLVKYKKETPDHVVVVHPHVVGHIFLRALLSIQIKKSTQFIFHIVGNFTRNLDLWSSLEHLLQKKNVHFFVPSESYKNVIAHFIEEDHLSVLPFPIEVQREKKQSGDRLKILYAGRFHHQKNVERLISELSIYAEKNQRSTQLTLAVYFDDTNPSTLGQTGVLGEQFASYQKVLSRKHPLLHVELLSHRNETELSALYRNHDLFMSFSTFFDEDYGYAVIESLAHGTPCIVSKWGGYQDFCQAFPEDCLGVDVHFEQEPSLEIKNLSLLIKQLEGKTVDGKKVEDYAGKEHLKNKLIKAFSHHSSFEFYKPLMKSFKTLDSEGFKKVYKSFW